MAKYLKKKEKRVKHPLILGMTIYAVIFLCVATVGLYIFWDYIEAYEASRPQNAIEAYAQQLTPEHISDLSSDVIAQIDQNLQSEEACRQVIRKAAEGSITYAKKTSASTDTKTVYVLRSGSTVIGSVTMTAASVDKYGFSYWEVSEETFDFSHLIGQVETITVDSTCQVSYNGVVLDESYVIADNIPYSAVEAFYDNYALPTQLTYQAGPVLSDGEFTVTDGDGNAIDLSDEAAMETLLDNCSADERTELDSFVQTFIKAYVKFTGSANKSATSNYHDLMKHVVKGSDLQNRMYMALDGLHWAQSKGDTLVECTLNRCTKTEEGAYICDVTYLVDTSGREGVVRTTNNVQFAVVRTDDGLKAELLVSY